MVRPAERRQATDYLLETVTVPLAPEGDRRYPPRSLQVHTQTTDSAYRLVTWEGLERLGHATGYTKTVAGRGLQLGLATGLAAYEGLYLHEMGHATAMRQRRCAASVSLTPMGAGSHVVAEECDNDYVEDPENPTLGLLKFRADRFRQFAAGDAAGINATQYAAAAIAARVLEFGGRDGTPISPLTS